MVIQLLAPNHLLLIAVWLCIVTAFVPMYHAHRPMAGAGAALLLWLWLAANAASQKVGKAEKTMSLIDQAMKHLKQM